MKVINVGGGLAFHPRGVRVEVLERAAEFTEVGWTPSAWAIGYAPAGPLLPGTFFKRSLTPACTWTI